MAVAKILARLGLDISEWQTNLKRAGQQADTFATSNLNQVKTAIAGAFTVGAIIHFADKVTRAADDTLDLAKATGATTDTLQALTAAAKATGATQEQVAQAMHKLRDAQGEVARNNTKIVDSFGQLGISAKEVQSLSIDTLFERVSVALNDGKGDASEYSAAIDILGKSALPGLNDILSQVADQGLAKFNKGMKEATGYLSKEELSNLAIAREQMNIGGQKAGNAGASFLGNFIGGFRVIAGMLSESTDRALGLSKKTGSVFSDVASSVVDLNDPNQRVTTSDERARAKAAEQERIRRRNDAETYRPTSAKGKGPIEAMFDADFQADAKRRDAGRKLIEDQQEAQYAAEKQAQRDALQRARIMRGGGGEGGIANDELSRIGGFVGGRTDPMRSAAERQVRIQEQLLDLARQIAARNTMDVSDK